MAPAVGVSRETEVPAELKVGRLFCRWDFSLEGGFYVPGWRTLRAGGDRLRLVEHFLGARANLIQLRL